MTGADDFTPEQEAEIRRRFVIDRVDGRPILSGHADCPDCNKRLVPRPFGHMDLGDERIHCWFFLECQDCGRSVAVDEKFDWGP